MEKNGYTSQNIPYLSNYDDEDIQDFNKDETLQYSEKSSLEDQSQTFNNDEHNNIQESKHVQKFKWKIGDFIGAGSFGQVFRAMNCNTGEIFAGINYLHSKKVIHKDIKGANILVGTDGVVKLSDFGCAKQLELTLNSNQDAMQKTLKGSVPWMSPEIVKQSKYNTKSDIWSFGCTILEMASAKPPWYNYQFDNPIAAIMKIGLSDEIPEIPIFQQLQ
ncbi:protein kinase family protein, putative [Ichthyophthirius multifiliis]|uniref:Protein kinase family protein, putative n=1 Tax=Ichthyophthirius multifiliis TaxID=5932 RepID=G0QMZ6_ICHMU|nr:protein kinase family protein, putative [Ichthyophthirius multifiliis]EGR33411.1 protein kinase family protein, putative [Ichthyophthirius multifiliis]|eukprot:XP_004037397.1 protein kinase family protein, putative [Ichthyophthirius multifiliis]